jgi:hypothetical protein
MIKTILLGISALAIAGATYGPVTNSFSSEAKPKPAACKCTDCKCTDCGCGAGLCGKKETAKADTCCPTKAAVKTEAKAGCCDSGCVCDCP